MRILGFEISNHITLLVFFLSVIGIIGIYFAIESITPIEMSIGSIESSMNGKTVVISGSVSNIRKNRSGNIYWTVDDGNNITVPILDNQFKKLTINVGDIVEIVGLVSEYKGEIEVMPKEIHMR